MNIHDKKAAATLPILRDQVWARWEYNCSADVRQLGLQEAGRFLGDHYAKPSWAVLFFLFAGAKIQAASQDGTESSEGATLASFPIDLQNTERFRQAIQAANPGPWRDMLTAHKKAAPHWQGQNSAFQNQAKRNLVLQHLAKAKIPQDLAEFLAEDLGRQHQHNCSLSSAFRWSKLKEQISKVASASETFVITLKGCDSETLEALEEARMSAIGSLGMPSLADPKLEESSLRYSPSSVLLGMMGSIQAAAVSVLAECPENSRASVTALMDAKHGFARRWLVLNAQTLLRILGLKAGNSADGPLMRFVRDVELAFPPPVDDSEPQKNEKCTPTSESNWPSQLVQEMRPGK